MHRYGGIVLTDGAVREVERSPELMALYEEIAEVMDLGSPHEVAMHAAQVLAFILKVGGGKFWVGDDDGVLHSLLVQRSLSAVKTPGQPIETKPDCLAKTG